MWAGGTDGTYRAALAGPHVAYNRVDVEDRSGNTLVSDISYTAGQVRATLQSRVARTIDLTVARSWFPVDSTGAVDVTAPLTPFGNRLRAWRGILYGDGSYIRFPVFYGRIETVRLRRSGDVQVTGADLAADVVDGTFETPQSSSTSLNVYQQFKALVIGALSDATFGTSDIANWQMPAITWESDRAKALDDLSTAAGMLWYPLADGSFVQRYLPWTNPDLSSVLTLRDGTATGSGGLLSDFEITLSRQGIYNSVVYTSERQDGTAPVYAIQRDTDPASPTYYLGDFGKKPLLVQNQSTLTTGQCSFAALTVLQEASAITLTWDGVQIVPDASLELGDVVHLSADGVTDEQVISGFTVPLRETGAMSLDLRAYEPLG